MAAGIVWVEAGSGSSDLSEYQRAVRADDAITLDEYNAAVDAAAECTRDSGAEIRTETLADGRKRFAYGGASSREELAPMSARYDECYSEFLGEIDRRWAADHTPPVGDIVAIELAMVECAIEKDVIPAERELTRERVRELVVELAMTDSVEAAICRYEAYEGKPITEPS